MVPPWSISSKGPQVLNRPSENGGLSVAFPTANQPDEDANERASSNIQGNIIARGTEIVFAILMVDIRAEDIGEDPIVMALCNEAAQTAPNIVASLTENVTEDIRTAPIDVGETSPKVSVDKETMDDPKATTVENVLTASVEWGASSDKTKIETRVEACEVIVIKNYDDEAGNDDRSDENDTDTTT